MTSNQSQTGGGGSGGTRRSMVLTRKKTSDNGRSSLTAPSPRPPTYVFIYHNYVITCWLVINLLFLCLEPIGKVMLGLRLEEIWD